MTEPETAAPTRDSDIGAARQKGRGRQAASPTQMPPIAWKEIAGRVFASISRDRVMLVAAGVTFYMLLALVPSLTAFIGVYGLVADQSTIVEHTNLMAGIIPGGGLEIIREQLQRLASEGNTALSWGVAVSIVIALWSASAGVKALFEAMNIAYAKPKIADSSR